MNKSLSKFLDIFWITLIISFSIYVYLDIKNIFSTLKQIQKEKIIYTMKIENETLAPLIKFGFNHALKEELKRLLKVNTAIRYIEYKNIKLGSKQNVTILTFPIIYNHKKIATIKVGYTSKYLLNSFKQKYFSKFIIYLIFILVISFLLLIYLRKRIKSLNILAQALEKLNIRKQKEIPLIDDYYEIKNITNALNKLIKQIHAFYNSQKELFKKLIISKKELETAQEIAEMFTWHYDCITHQVISQNFRKIKNKFNINKLEDFINHVEEKDNVFKKLELLCKNKLNSINEIVTLNLSGKKYHFRVEAKFIKTKKLIIGICANITEEIKRQEEISFLAYHDPLTGLVNRTFLQEQLKTLTSIADRNNKKIALIFIDLDNFKFINDTFGHEMGDKLLIEIANRLKHSIRKSDIASRIGGDEFILVLNNINSKQEVEKKIEEIMNILTKPIIIDDNKLEVTFSAGIAVYPDDTTDISKLLQFADIAMYDAKKSGKNRFKFININLQQQIKKFYSTLEELKNAIKNEELILFFQPKIDIQNNKIDGVEALIRWNHPRKGLLTPYHFIDIAEKGGIIHLIDSYVLEKTIQTINKWSTNPILKNLNIAVNISANKFLEPHFVDELKSLITKYHIDPSKLQIEITETLSIQNFEYTIQTLKKIKSLGVKIALDDFGTGYSSLNYIKQIPFDVLKIDQSFIRDLLKDRDDLIITKMIVEISKILNKENVAEGVENEKILEIIKNLGVRLVQGYYFSKPIPEDELKKFILNFEKNQ